MSEPIKPATRWHARIERALTQLDQWMKVNRHGFFVGSLATNAVWLAIRLISQ